MRIVQVKDGETGKVLYEYPEAGESILTALQGAVARFSYMLKKLEKHQKKGGKS